MICLRRARSVFGLTVKTSVKASSSPRPSSSSFYIATRIHPRRALHIKADSHNKDLFAYTSGNWVYNNALRLKERIRLFDVDELCRLAAESANQSPANVVNIVKLAEGGFNRTFLITFRDDFQMVARIPYPIITPKFYALASEVATIEYLHASGLPVPKIYGYSPDANNAAGTEYMFMQYIKGESLTDVWPSLTDQEVVSVIKQITSLESRMMSLEFPAGGSLYFTKDLEKVAPGQGVLLNGNARFSVGPDTRVTMWYGRRSELNVDRGPYRDLEATLVAGAKKELAYLKDFGRPLLPVRRERRPGYQFQVQSPLAHVENLERYLRIAPSLPPKDPALRRFCIRHPDLQPSNIIVSRPSATSNSSDGQQCQIISLLDWQHAAILPLFFLAGVPQRFQNYADPVSQSMVTPSRPEYIEELDGDERMRAEEKYRERLVHYSYVTNMLERNKSHYAAFTDPMYALRGRLYLYACSPWEGETFELKVALIEATEKWEALTGGETPCPITFNVDDVRETRKLNEVQERADETFAIWQNFFGLGEEGWVSTEDYEDAVAFYKKRKEEGLAATESAEGRAEIMGHWPWDDIEEEEY